VHDEHGEIVGVGARDGGVGDDDVRLRRAGAIHEVERAPLARGGAGKLRRLRLARLPRAEEFFDAPERIGVADVAADDEHGVVRDEAAAVEFDEIVARDGAMDSGVAETTL
jgi:hypothetical protein